MDYEKAYKEALKRAKSFRTPDNKDVAAYIFPELAESEDGIKDERIRKAVISTFKSHCSFYEVSVDEVLAWFEKQFSKSRQKEIDDAYLKGICDAKQELEEQGQQKPQRKSALEAAKEEKIDNTNKAEPKFKAGDWVVCGQYGAPCQIESIKNGRYYFTSGIGIPVENVNIDYHLWNIQEAKDGDVLCCEKGWTCIFKTLVNDETFSSYCFMDNTKWFCETGSECHTLKEEFVKAYNGKIYPATKEQRDLLFQKMKEAGYDWDTEKKELKKIEQKPTEWSEEDENKITLFMQLTEGCDNYEELQDWLISLKNRVQPKQEWSEEDEINLFECIKAIKGNYSTAYAQELSEWLKSLRPQSTWKPSGEQVEAFEHFVRSIGESGCASPYDNNTKLLYSLLEQLKKLKEE